MVLTVTKVIPLREMLDEDTYRRYEPKWSTLRMNEGLEPLPPTWQKFKEYMGWDDDNH